MKSPVDMWEHPATIERNHFVAKSLSCWSYNVAVGCEHGCRFCYVPSVSTIKQGPKLKEYGVQDPDAEWGYYLLIRHWDGKRFLASLNKAQNTPTSELNPDGNRAVMLCTTTDPYQVVHHKDPTRRAELTNNLSTVVRHGLLNILEHSDLNVRILTRSPLAVRDFEIFQRFGKRLLFGMSIPTLNCRLAKIYEPRAPAPARRLETLQKAREAGLNVFVAVAPTYPECDYADILETVKAIKGFDPITVFFENINIRSENVARIAAEGKRWGVDLRTEVFSTPARWAEYAQWQLNLACIAAHEVGLSERLHLWPDKSLGRLLPQNVRNYAKWWNRISEWPK